MSILTLDFPYEAQHLHTSPSFSYLDSSVPHLPSPASYKVCKNKYVHKLRSSDNNTFQFMLHINIYEFGKVPNPYLLKASLSVTSDWYTTYQAESYLKLFLSKSVLGGTSRKKKLSAIKLACHTLSK